MVQFEFENLTKAWEGINEMFIRNDKALMGEGKRLTNSSFAYDVWLKINNPQMDPEFKYGKYFHYTSGKWNKLLGNYLNLDGLDYAKDQIRMLEKNLPVRRYYTVAFQFGNSGDDGKGCLLSGIFSREIDSKMPKMTIFIRAAEVTSRMSMDFLFFQRLGEYIYRDKPFLLEVFIKQAWAEDNLLLMYHNHRSIKRVLKESTDEKHKAIILKALDKMLNGKEADFIKYQAHLRTFKTLRSDLYPKAAKTRTLLAKDCVIGDWDGIPMPPSCPSIAQRNLIKKHLEKLKEKFGLDLTKGTIQEVKPKEQKVFDFKPHEDTLRGLGEPQPEVELDDIDEGI